MNRKVAGKQIDLSGVERGAAASPTPMVIAPTSAAQAVLVDLAEELGRLFARQELARLNRRGYSLPDLVIGAFVMALVWFLVGRLSGCLSR